MRYIFELELKKMISNKASSLYIFGYCLVCGIFIPYFFTREFDSMSTILILSAIAQISPGVFAKEREDRTFETMLSLPVSMKKIFMSKTIFSFTIIACMLHISYILNYGMSFFLDSSSFKHFDLRNVLVYFPMLVILIFNMAYQATYTSFISRDSKATAIKTTYTSMPYYLMAAFIIEVSKRSDRFFSLYILIFLLINLIIFIILTLRTKKYFKKSSLLQLLND